MQKILITGSSGLIGSELIQLLLEKYKVYAISKNKHLDIKHNNLTLINLDLSKQMDIKKLPNKIDTIIHLAQSNHHKNFPEKALDIFNINVNSTMQFLDYAKKIRTKRFIYASSGSVYGLKKEKCRETDILSPSNLTFYPLTKLQSELFLETYKDFFSIVILRYFFVYGHNQKENMLFPNLINNISQNKEITLLGENGLWINPINVKEAATATYRALLLNGLHKINIAGDKILSLKSICEFIGKIINKKLHFAFDKNKLEQSLIGDNTKMKKLLIKPRISFYSSLRKIIEQKIKTMKKNIYKD